MQDKIYIVSWFRIYSQLGELKSNPTDLPVGWFWEVDGRNPQQPLVMYKTL